MINSKFPYYILYGEAADLDQADLRPRQFHGPGSFTPLLLLMCPVGGGGYTVKKKQRSLLFLCVHLNIKIILGYQIIGLKYL